LPQPFPDSDPLEIAGRGPWRLRLGQGTNALATTIADPVLTLAQAGEWWIADGQRSSTPTTSPTGLTQLQVEFLLPSQTTPYQIREIELTLGYEQINFLVGVLGWSLPAASVWIVPLPNAFEAILEPDPLVLTPNLPSLSAIHYRRIDILLPAETNLGMLLDLSFVSAPLGDNQFPDGLWSLILALTSDKIWNTDPPNTPQFPGGLWSADLSLTFGRIWNI
jgi:hypothetical protein